MFVFDRKYTNYPSFLQANAGKTILEYKKANILFTVIERWLFMLKEMPIYGRSDRGLL